MFYQVNRGAVVFWDGEVAVVEDVFAFAGERHYLGVGMERGNVVGVAIGFMEVSGFHGRYGCDGVGG